MRRTTTALPRVSPIMQPMNSVGYERYWSARKRRAWSDRISFRTIGPRVVPPALRAHADSTRDRKSTRLNSSHLVISYAVFCLKKKKDTLPHPTRQLVCSHFFIYAQSPSLVILFRSLVLVPSLALYLAGYVLINVYLGDMYS